MLRSSTFDQFIYRGEISRQGFLINFKFSILIHNQEATKNQNTQGDVVENKNYNKNLSMKTYYV